MNEKIDLSEILKNCPEGTKFWSDVVGQVQFKEIKINEDTLQTTIVLIDRNNKAHHLEKWGNFNGQFPECCVLWPSKNVRRWDEWKCPIQKFEPKTLQPFDRVLAASMADGRWVCDFFSHIGESIRDSGRLYVGTGFGAYDRMIPYNEETKHLVGTTDEAPEYYRYWEE